MSEQPSRQPDYAQRAVDHWKRFAVPEHENRAALASLRRGLGEPPGSVTDMYHAMPPFVFDLYRSRKEAVFIVGALFGLHWQAPALDKGEPFTTALKLTERSESYEKRIQALLRSDLESLPTHLRHAVTYIRSKRDARGAAIPVDWAQLIRHVANWDHPDRYVQQRWAEAWWGTRFDRERPEQELPPVERVPATPEN